MTSSNNPDEIRAQIERTRAELSHNVNALSDSVNPARVAKRQTAKVRGAMVGVKDRVMGSAADAGSGLSSAQSTIGDSVAAAPAELQARVTGNPLAAGLVAFGVGLLAASLLPSSSIEQQAAAKAKDVAAPVVTDAAREVGDHLREPAQQAVDSVKGTATDAVATVKDEGVSATHDVQQHATQAKDTVTEQSS